MRTLKTALAVLLLDLLSASCGSDTASPLLGNTSGSPGTSGKPDGGSVTTGATVGSGGTALGSGGAVGTGGSAISSGGNPSSGASTGGAASTGGTGTGAGGTAMGGGTSTGGTTLGSGGTVSTGGSPAVGGTTSTGGSKATGGATTAGGTSSTGGSNATGGATASGGSQAAGGMAGNCPALSPSLFAIGADLSFQETASAAARANLLETYKAHGFNYVRLRTFVDPKAADGYDKTNGYCDIAHTVDFGKQVKDACMGLLVNFHYSDNWADPGKQCVPVAWQGHTTIADLATAVYDYTKDAITKLVAGGARPDMVQIGNEETPGILIHLCDSGGLPKAGIAGYNPVNGALYLWSSTDSGAPPAGGPSAGGWTNLGMLLSAAAKGVKDVDSGIQVALHLDRCNELASSRNYIQNATSKGVPFDIFAESCYSGTQGQPSDWQSTFTSLASSFPNLKLMIAEYSGEQKAANDILFNLPNQQGIGTFTFTPSTAQATLAIYDQMKIDYASRL